MPVSASSLAGERIHAIPFLPRHLRGQQVASPWGLRCKHPGSSLAPCPRALTRQVNLWLKSLGQRTCAKLL